jgi:TolB-like protein
MLACAALSPAAETSIENAVKKFAENNKRLRIAVLDFANTDGTKTRFDTYIADTIVSELSKYSLTLLERKKLEVLLGEHALSQAGLVDSNKALKLGTLLPVDVVVSGSYTELSGRLMINARFIHVGTGEILYAFTSSMESTPDVSSQKRQADECERRQETIKKALNTLGDQSAVNKAVDAAMTVPFQDECGSIHFHVMYTFSKHKIYDTRYQQFLLKAFATIEVPSEDRRTVEILNYFASDGKIDQAEWDASVEVFKRMNGFALATPLRYMLSGDQESGATIRARAEELMRLAADNKIGRPKPLPREAIFFAIMSGLDARSRKADGENALILFKKYQGLVPDDDANNKKAFEIIRSLYTTEMEKDVHKGSLPVLIGFLKSRNPSDLLAEKTADVIKSVEAKTERPREQEKTKAARYQEDLATLHKSLSGLYCMSIGVAKKKGYRYIVEERTISLLKQSLTCDQATSLKDLETEMRSGDWDKKLKAVELLSKLGEAAKPVEKTLIKYLGQQGYGDQGGRLRRFCALTLGNIRTTDPDGITMLIESFPDYNNGVSHEAEEAIKKIGIDALPYLIQGLNHKEHAVRFRCASALGNLGNKAKKALPELQRLAEKDSDPYVRKEAKGAVQMIQNDF